MPCRFHRTLESFVAAPAYLFCLLLEREAHFVGLAESQIFVERASEIAGMQGDAAQAPDRGTTRSP